MRRTERLFRIIQILRGADRPVTGAALAESLEISLRALYRDMAELRAQRVPVRGEAGVGYVLEEGYDLPPLMLTGDELEAAVLGAAWVASKGDPSLAQAARDLVSKLSDVVPEELRPVVLDATLRPVSFVAQPEEAFAGAELRRALRMRLKLRLRYADGEGVLTERTVWPLFLGYMEEVRLVVTWCELRNDFRTFRTDRIRDLVVLDECYPPRRAQLIADWKRQLRGASSG